MGGEVTSLTVVGGLKKDKQAQQQRYGHYDHPELQKLPRRDLYAFATQDDEPKNGGKGAGDREVRAEINADQNGMLDGTAEIRVAQRSAAREADGKVVHAIR